MKRSFTSLVMLSLASLLFAQQNGINKEKFRLAIKRASSNITIDGKLDEEAWQEADITTPFLNKWPLDEGEADLQTKVRVTYDDRFLYIGARCSEENQDHVIQTLKRDDVIWRSDGFGVFIDPVNQQTNGFAFFTNAYGVQTEGLISGFIGTNDEGMSRDWDNKWYTEAYQFENGDWSVEMAIPFKTLRYDSRLQEWGINFIRCDLGNNRYSTWTSIPLQFNGPDLAWAGTMVWDNPPPETKSNFSIIPYITGDVSRDDEENDGKTSANFDAGLDAKVAVTSSLNLDLTLNPDFSQVEVDVQQTNLTRFSLFFPERRTFFLENSDIFADYGIRPIRPFFSRRIGLDDDGNAIPIIGGARLSGNLFEDTRIGIMNMQTASTDNVKAQNYSVATVQQQLFKRSSLKGIFINRQAFSEGAIDDDDFGRNAGGEFDYVTEDGSFQAWIGAHTSMKPEDFSDNGFYSGGFAYNSKQFTTLQSYVRLGENYIADVGFINRLDNYDAARDTTVRIGYQHWFQTYQYSIFPKSEDAGFNFIRFNVENYMLWNDGLGLTLRNTELGGNIFLANTSFLGINFTNTRETLPFETNFTDEDEYENLPAATYEFSSAGFFFESNRRKLFSVQLNGSYGGFYNGTLFQLGGSLNYRKQPWGNFALNFERSILSLPDEYGEAKLWLVGPRIEINFSKNIFWTTFLQYNTQADNFNINSRLQWRYQPMSDLFLVYTDNYTAENFGNKSRALVLKFNYWLTI